MNNRDPAKISDAAALSPVFSKRPFKFSKEVGLVLLSRAGAAASVSGFAPRHPEDYRARARSRLPVLTKQPGGEHMVF